MNLLHIYEEIAGLRNSRTVVPEKKNNSFQFHSSAAPYDIRWDEIGVCRQRPLAFIECNNKWWVLVHNSLLVKGYVCNIPSPFGKCDGPHQDSRGYAVPVDSLVAWKQWASDVKKARWPEGEKGIVTVSFPSV